MLYSIRPLYVQTLTNHIKKQRIRQHQTKILDNHIFSENISQPSNMSAQKNVKKQITAQLHTHTHTHTRKRDLSSFKPGKYTRKNTLVKTMEDIYKIIFTI